MEGLFDKKHIYGNFQDQPDSNRRNQFPLDIETLEALQNNTSLAAAIGNLTGSDKAILCGCNGTPRTEGYVWMKTPRAPITGELLYYPGGGAGSDSDQCHIVEDDSDITIDSTTYAEAYTTRHLANGAGATTYTFGTFAKVTLAGLLDKIQEQHDNIEALKNNAQYTFVRGMILIWSGYISEIPSGWALCDGANGTPDLRGRFIVGAGRDGVTAGYYKTKSKNSESPTRTVQFTLRAEDLPAHRHMYIGDSNAPGDDLTLIEGVDGRSGAGKGYGAKILTDSMIYDADRTHGVRRTSSTITSLIDVRPPYYALAFIMKL